MSEISKPLAPMDFGHRIFVCARVVCHNRFYFAAGAISTISPMSDALPALE